ncbi:MAG: hypothetical protein F6K14_21160 [Symploca sp. SIO2C1]|nr:hypothetical protein [Symploca sp. SIO2C1]
MKRLLTDTKKAEGRRQNPPLTPPRRGTGGSKVRKPFKLFFTLWVISATALLLLAHNL